MAGKTDERSTGRVSRVSCGTRPAGMTLVFLALGQLRSRNRNSLACRPTARSPSYGLFKHSRLLSYLRLKLAELTAQCAAARSAVTETGQAGDGGQLSPARGKFRDLKLIGFHGGGGGRPNRRPSFVRPRSPRRRSVEWEKLQQREGNTVAWSARQKCTTYFSRICSVPPSFKRAGCCRRRNFSFCTDLSN